MTAWHGDPNLKAEVLARMIEHRKEDSIIQGHYQKVDDEFASGYTGCLIGCTLPHQADADPWDMTPASGWHGEVEKLYGIPMRIGYLLDRIFERLPLGAHAEFAVASIEAIPVGADLSLVPSRLMLDVLGSFLDEKTIELHRRRISGDEPSESEWAIAHKMAENLVTAFAASNKNSSHADALVQAGRREGRDWWAVVALRLLQHLREAPVLDGQIP